MYKVRRYEAKIGGLYKITYRDTYSGRIARVVSIDCMGDVTLEFKNGRRVVYHECWLEGVSNV